MGVAAQVMHLAGVASHHHEGGVTLIGTTHDDAVVDRPVALVVLMTPGWFDSIKGRASSNSILLPQA